VYAKGSAPESLVGLAELKSPIIHEVINRATAWHEA
jgi:hypothetical protein